MKCTFNFPVLLLCLPFLIASCNSKRNAQGNQSQDVDLLPIIRSGKSSYIDENGKTCIAGPFREAGQFIDNIAIVKNFDGVYGILQKSGQCTYYPQYDELISISENFICVSKNNKYGYISYSGKKAILPQYEEAYPFSEGLAAVGVRGNDGIIRYSYIDKRNRIKISGPFDSAPEFSDGFARVSALNRFYYIDHSGKELITPNIIVDSGLKFEDGIAAISIKKQGRKYWGFISDKGAFIIPPIFDLADSFIGNYATVKLNGRYKIIDKSNNTILDFDAEEASSPHYGILRYKQGGWGFMSIDGKIIHEPVLEFAHDYNGKWAQIEKCIIQNDMAYSFRGYFFINGKEFWDN